MIEEIQKISTFKNMVTPELLEKIQEIKPVGKKIGFACGVFDLFHVGHVLMLKECKQHCDFLVIAVNKAEQFSSIINPGKKKTLYSYEERVIIMQNSKYVDAVVGYSSEEELLQLLKSLKIDVRFLGDDYKGKPITGADVNIKIHYIDRSHGVSTSLYRERMESQAQDQRFNSKVVTK